MVHDMHKWMTTSIYRGFVQTSRTGTMQKSICAWWWLHDQRLAQVDGMGNSLLNFDDPNVPSLLSIPLLGYVHYDPEIYAATRARILSPANAWYFEGSTFRGLGSPHTPHSHVWPLAMSVQVWSASLDKDQGKMYMYICLYIQ